MSKAELCKCGHVKSAHLTKSKGDKRWHGKCDWFDCHCKRYVFAEKKSIISGARQYETMIENPNYERINMEYSKPKGLLISECNRNGIAGTMQIKCKNCKQIMTEMAFNSHKKYCKSAKMVLP